MIDDPKEKYPYAPIMKRITTWPFLTDYATAIDAQLHDICDRVPAQPRLVEGVVATGSMQSVPIGTTLAKPPAIVRAIVSEVPCIDTESGLWPCSYRVEYGTHSKDTISVRIRYDVGDTEIKRPAKFDLLIFP